MFVISTSQKSPSIDSSRFLLEISRFNYCALGFPSRSPDDRKSNACHMIMLESSCLHYSALVIRVGFFAIPISPTICRCPRKYPENLGAAQGTFTVHHHQQKYLIVCLRTRYERVYLEPEQFIMKTQKLYCNSLSSHSKSEACFLVPTQL